MTATKKDIDYFKRWLLAAALLASACATPTIQSQNLSCKNNLTMYGWGLASGTFSNASTPNNQNLWVAEISTGNPEIHVTFNKSTQLHLTVRAGSTCDGYVNLGGTFPGHMTLVAPLPPNGKICGVSVAPYLARLNGINSVPPLPHPLPANACVNGFNTQTKLSQTAKGAYLALCGDPTCQ
jgi:hypothetical protein